MNSPIWPFNRELTPLSKKWMFRIFKTEVFGILGRQLAETFATTGLPKNSKHSISTKDYKYRGLRHRPLTLSQLKNALRPDPFAPTCDEEADALNGAPPWAGFWLEPPTITQRFKHWTDYAAHQIRKLPNDGQIPSAHQIPTNSPLTPGVWVKE